MTDEKMPAAEAVAEAEERFSYELAFHVLPTVAEGEVTSVFEAIKAHITNAGGECGVEEAPQRIDLAYEVVKHLEGKNRRFTSAYFGWVRFTAEAAALATITEGLDEETNVLRHLLLKLTKAEEAHPFYYHEAMAAQKQIVNVEEAEVVEKPKAKEVIEEVKEEATEEVAEEVAATEADTSEEDTKKDEA